MPRDSRYKRDLPSIEHATSCDVATGDEKSGLLLHGQVETLESQRFIDV